MNVIANDCDGRPRFVRLVVVLYVRPAHAAHAPITNWMCARNQELSTCSECERLTRKKGRLCDAALFSTPRAAAACARFKLSAFLTSPQQPTVAHTVVMNSDTIGHLPLTFMAKHKTRWVHENNEK